MDKIIISAADEEFLFEVYRKMEEDFGNQKEIYMPLKGPFEIYMQPQELKAVIKVLSDENGLCVTLLTIQPSPFRVDFNLDMNLMPQNIVYCDHLKQGLKTYKEAIDETIRVLTAQMTSFFYILNNLPEHEVITVKEVINQKKKVNKSSKKRNKASSSTIRVVNKVYRISNEQEVVERVRRIMKRKWRVDEFTRRGHFRTYKKSGKTVWVKPSVIKTGANTGEVGSKTYRL